MKRDEKKKNLKSQGSKGGRIMQNLLCDQKNLKLKESQNSLSKCALAVLQTWANVQNLAHFLHRSISSHPHSFFLVLIVCAL